MDCFSSDTLWLFEECFGLSRKDIIIKGNELAPFEKAEKFFQMVKMRLKRIPVQYIVGNCRFMGINLDIGSGVLIPRDDTEVLVRKTAELLEEKFNLIRKPMDVIDLCSGSVAIALSLKKLLGTKINVYALELYEAPFKYLENNVLKNKLDIKIIKGDIFTDYKNFETISLLSVHIFESKKIDESIAFVFIILFVLASILSFSLFCFSLA